MRVWISGGTGGLGLKIAEMVVENGCHALAVTDIRPQEEGDRLVNQLLNSAPSKEGAKILYFPVDVRDVEAVERSMRAAARQFGGLEVVVNNAGVINESSLIHTMQVNAIGCIQATEAAIRVFEEINKASRDDQNHTNTDCATKVILNISSASGLFPFPTGEYYSASKHAVVGYSKSIAPYALKLGVRVVCFCPAWVNVGMGMIAITKRSDIVRKSGIRVMGAAQVTDVIGDILCSQDHAGKVIYLSEDTGTRYAQIGLSKRPMRLSKL